MIILFMPIILKYLYRITFKIISEHLFIYFLPVICLLRKNVQVLCSFFNWIVCLVLSFMSSLYILILTPCQNYYLKISSSIRLIAFLFGWHFLLLCEAFKFDIVPLIYFCIPLPLGSNS